MKIGGNEERGRRRRRKRRKRSRRRERKRRRKRRRKRKRIRIRIRIRTRIRIRMTRRRKRRSRSRGKGREKEEMTGKIGRRTRGEEEERQIVKTDQRRWSIKGAAIQYNAHRFRRIITSLPHASRVTATRVG